MGILSLGGRGAPWGRASFSLSLYSHAVSTAEPDMTQARVLRTGSTRAWPRAVRPPDGLGAHPAMVSWPSAAGPRPGGLRGDGAG